MKAGISVQKLIDTIEREQEEKIDYLVRPGAINTVIDDRGVPKLAIKGYGDFRITTHALMQLGEFTLICWPTISIIGLSITRELG